MPQVRAVGFSSASPCATRPSASASAGLGLGGAARSGDARLGDGVQSTPTTQRQDLAQQPLLRTHSGTPQQRARARHRARTLELEGTRTEPDRLRGRCARPGLPVLHPACFLPRPVPDTRAPWMHGAPSLDLRAVGSGPWRGRQSCLATALSAVAAIAWWAPALWTGMHSECIELVVVERSDGRMR